MKNAEVTIPQTNVNLSFAASARDQVVHAIKYITGLDMNASTEDLDGQRRGVSGDPAPKPP